MTTTAPAGSEAVRRKAPILMMGALLVCLVLPSIDRTIIDEPALLT